MKKIIILSLTWLGLALPASAAGVLSELAACAQTKDSLARLVCYDKLAEQSLGNKAIVATKKQSVTKAAATPAMVKAPVAKRAPSEEESFGGEHLKSADDQVMEIAVTVTSVKKTLRDLLKLTFDNGQIWQQTDSGAAPRISTGDKVVIKRGALGSFYLKKADSNRTVRVKRIK